MNQRYRKQSQHEMLEIILYKTRENGLLAQEGKIIDTRGIKKNGQNSR